MISIEDCIKIVKNILVVFYLELKEIRFILFLDVVFGLNCIFVVGWSLRLKLVEILCI